MTRKLYPYWDEIFEGIELFAQNLEELKSVLNHPAALNRLEEPNSGERMTLGCTFDISYRKTSFIFRRFHVAIRPKLKIKTRYLPMLIWDSIIRVCEQGMDVSLYLALWFLLEETREELNHHPEDKWYTFAAKAVCLAELVLLDISGEGWFSMSSKEFLEPSTLHIIFQTGWLPNPRTLGSWKDIKVEKFLELRIVPMEQFLTRDGSSVRYSGYTKGYHESGKGYTRDGQVYGIGKTPFDPEIDEDRSPEEESHHLVDEDPVYQVLSQSIAEIREERYSGK